MTIQKMIQLVKKSIPPLTSEKHKGQAGRIGIIGGSLEYTGAPYFAAISALKVGADLVHIFCTQAAAPVIKSYSPELIVHPLLDTKNGVDKILPWLERLHVIVIGPGLGREEQIFKNVSEIIGLCRQLTIPLVIDADGLNLITERPELIYHYPEPGIILTPNKIEFQRLSQVIQSENSTDDYFESDFKRLGKGITVLRKGQTDQLFSSDPSLNWTVSEGGSNRRCGGQGDLLSGSIATFFNWALSNGKSDKTASKNLLSASTACYGASKLVRLCNEKAYALKGRGMLASDMIEEIHKAFRELYEDKNE